MKNENMKRRDFLKTLGFAALVISPISAVQAEENVSPNEGLVVRSGKSRFAPLPGHFHYLIVPLTLFQNPPAVGAKLKTSVAYHHHHVVKLTQAQLVTVAQGKSVVVPDTVKDHMYEIRLVQNLNEIAG